VTLAPTTHGEHHPAADCAAYNGKSAIEFVALLSGQTEVNGYDIVRAFWQKQHRGADFEQFWRKSLHDGWIEGTTYQPKTVTAKAQGIPIPSAADSNAIELTSVAIPPSTTDNFPTTAGCRNCPSR